MNNNLLQLKIKQRLNKLASMDYDNLECWMVAEAFNKAQLEWVRRQVYGINTRKQGMDQSTGTVDDLQKLVRQVPVAGVAFQEYFEAPLPQDYLYYVRTDVFAKTECCPERRMTTYEVEESNMGVLLTSDTKGPSFQWAETLVTLLDGKLRVYTDGDFVITKCQLVYMREPRPVQFSGCIDLNSPTGAVFTQDQTCEFKDDICEVLVDSAAAILAGDMESITQYQRASESVKTNS